MTLLTASVCVESLRIMFNASTLMFIILILVICRLQPYLEIQNSEANVILACIILSHKFINNTVLHNWYNKGYDVKNTR